MPHEPRETGWDPRSLTAYAGLIDDDSSDSVYLRERGLHPQILDLLGDCSEETLLDVGCGTGWLLDAVPHRRGHMCDIVPGAGMEPDPRFRVEDIRRLSYESNLFDVVVANLVLMWVNDLHQACQETLRVTRPGGRFLVSLTHPFSYRNGFVDTDGRFCVTERYAESRLIHDLHIGGTVGPFVYYHRPLSVYLNTFLESGWRLAGLHEGTLDMEDYQRARPGPPGRVKRTDRVPMFVFLQFYRP